MGANESKSDDELAIVTDDLEENLLEYIQQNDTNQREEDERRIQQHEQDFMNELHETVIPDQSHTFVPKNKMDSHNLFSSESNRNSLTLAELNINRSEPDEEIDNSLINLRSVFNKSVENESDLLIKELNLATNNPRKDLHSNSNKNVEFTCDLNTNATETDDLVIKIKSELLTDDYNLQLENPDEETNVDLEAINSKEINEEQIVTLNTGSSTEIIPFTSNSIGEDNDLLSDNFCLNEKRNLVQILESNTELLKAHANELENTEEQLLVDQSDTEILNIAQPFIADNSNASPVDQDWPTENQNISAIEIYQPKDTLLAKNINDPEPVNIAKTSNEIKEGEIYANTKESANVGDSEKLMIIDENINNDILCFEKTIKNIKIEQIELANNETPKTINNDCAFLDVIENGLSPEITVFYENIFEDIVNIEVTTTIINTEQIELAVDENCKTNETNKISAALHLNTHTDVFQDISNVEVSNKDIKIEQVELDNTETIKTTDKELAVVVYNENINIVEKVLSQKNTVSDKTIADDLLSIEVTKINIKTEQIELASNENPKINIIEQRLSSQTIELDQNINEDNLNIEKSHKKIKIEQIELDIDECLNNNVDAIGKESTENLNNNQERLLPKSTVCENSNEEPLTEIKIEPLIIDVDENSNNSYVESTDDCIIESVKYSVKESFTNTNLISKTFLKENINAKPLNIENLSKEIKIESVKVDVKENSKTNVKDTDYEQITKYNFVKNPFAFLKNLCKPTEKQPKNRENIKLPEKFGSTNISTQAEIIIDDSDDELEITATSTVVFKEENVADVHEKILETNKEIPIKTEPTNKLTVKTDDDDDDELHFNKNSTWNDVSIKREQIEECLEKNPDKNEDILNASLDVNVDNSLTSDVDDTFFSQSANDLLSNSTQITSTPSSEYYSIIDLVDDNTNLDPKSNVPTTEQNKETKIQRKWRGRPKGSRDLKPRKHRLTARKAIEKAKSSSYANNKSKRRYIKKKTKKSQKYTEKDSVFHASKHYFYKKLPKIHIVTRTKETTQESNSTITNNNKEKSTNGDFPKPFKLEMASKSEKNIATVLPKPIVYKTESSRGMPAYNMPEFQPRVRLKRLKSPDLLVPLKMRKISNRSRTEYKKPAKSYPFVTKSTSQQLSQPRTSKDQQDFQIQQAYSLNPRIKYRPLSLDQDFSSVHTTSSESKYFTQQELSTIFLSSTPGESRRFSGQFLGGVPASTPISKTQRQSQEQNRTLLLEIAAERAFINNHLLHFGFSPVHFELFNDINDLNVFLKYLFGHMNLT